MMRAATIVVVWLTVAAHGESTESGFVVIDAILVPSYERQPTQIALVRKGETDAIHVPVGKAIMELPPGRYRVDHIDFAEPLLYGDHLAFDLDVKKGYEFEVRAATVSYFGMLQFERHLRSLRVVLVPDVGLIQRACEADPEVFATHRLWLVNHQRFEAAINAKCGAT